jgi:curli biogenesis system outer membrane secretion channel CsgG
MGWEFKLTLLSNKNLKIKATTFNKEKIRILSFISAGALALFSTGCTSIGSANIIEENNEPLIKGPAISEIVSPFDRALSCLDGRIDKNNLRFSVGAISDATGKEQLTEGGSGKFVTQGAGDIVQSALFRAGVVVVNRRDPRVMESEARWGIRDAKTQMLSTFYITGSINSLDFLPGGGFEAQVGGVGPRFRRHRMLVGLDLSLTETRTGRIMSNIPLQKQIVATEEGFGVGRFFGDTLVSLDFGQNRREAVNYALRQMLNLATFELLTQVMKPQNYHDCYAMIESVDGVLGESKSAKKIAEYRADLAKPKETKTAKGTDGENVKKSAELAVAIETTSTVSPEQKRPVAPSSVAESSSLAAKETQSSDAEPKPSSAKIQALEIHRSSATETESTPTVSNAPVPVAAAMAAPQTAPVTALPLQPVIKQSSNGLTPENWPGYCVTHNKRINLPKVTPVVATTGGNELMISSASATTLCLSDSVGQNWLVNFIPNTQNLFQGQAPWRIQSEDLKKININYQGQDLRVPSYVKDRMELLERQ